METTPMIPRSPRRLAACVALLATALLAPPVRAADDGSQMESPFRTNYLGYYAQGQKIALFLSEAGGSRPWALVDRSGTTVASGVTKDHVADDFASGDSFFRIDFSSFTGTGIDLRLVVDGVRSEPFDVSATNPYGALADEAFDYFKDHRAGETTFDQVLHDWASGAITAPFWIDAGDRGSYPTNTAMAAWLLMNLYERYPAARAAFANGVTLYDEVQIGTELLYQVILPGQKLAIPKLHTNIQSWGPCPPHETGTCVSRPETKATFAVARALAHLARLHLEEDEPTEAGRAFHAARTAFTNARTAPATCRTAEDFGGEGGIYPDNDVYGIWREPRADREPCRPHRDNTEDDGFAALVEMFLAAEALAHDSAAALRQEVVEHPRFGEISEFWWGAVAATGNLSLLTRRPAGIDLSPIRTRLFRYADERIVLMGVGYPGVTKDARSDRWDSGDRDDVDNNWRWGSNRMLLDDAVLLAVAAEEKHDAGEGEAAARYARHALRVMDYILGTNGMALSMVTGFGEHAVQRTHDGQVPDTEPGKMALGPNNWTNSNDPDMPEFGSLPGMKMMPATGTGWAAREIAIDGNAPLVWMAWWARHQAPGLLALGPLGDLGSAGASASAPRPGVENGP
jgi:endoglucanase